MDKKEFTQAMDNFLDMLTREFDDNLDPDGSNYNNALNYAKEHNIDTKNMKEVAEAIKEINATENKLVELLDSGSEEEKEAVRSKLDELHSLNIGLLSMMIELRNTNYKA